VLTGTEGRRLDPELARFYETFGFLRLRGLFRDEVDTLSAVFDELVSTYGITGWPNFDPERRHRKTVVPDPIAISAEIREFSNDARLLDVVRTLVGNDFTRTGSMATAFHEDTEWHFDSYGVPKGVHTIKTSLYLDRLDGRTGALRVLPGTHFRNSPYCRHLREAMRLGVDDAFGVSATELPATVIENEPGDLIVWNVHTLHGSYGGGAYRRQLLFGFADASPDPPQT